MHHAFLFEFVVYTVACWRFPVVQTGVIFFFNENPPSLLNSYCLGCIHSWSSGNPGFNQGQEARQEGRRWQKSEDQVSARQMKLLATSCSESNWKGSMGRRLCAAPTKARGGCLSHFFPRRASVGGGGEPWETMKSCSPGSCGELITSSSSCTVGGAKTNPEVPGSDYCWSMASGDGWRCLLCRVWLCDPMDYSPLGSSVHGDSPGKKTGVGCHFLLQRLFPTQGLNLCFLCLLHWQAGSLPLSHLGNSRPLQEAPVLCYLLEMGEAWDSFLPQDFLIPLRGGWQSFRDPCVYRDKLILVWSA